MTFGGFENLRICAELVEALDQRIPTYAQGRWKDMRPARPEPARIAKLRRLLEERSIGTLLVTQRENVRYLSGFTGSAGSMLVAQGRPVLVTDFRYAEQARAEAPGTLILIQRKDHSSAVREAAERLGAAQVWFDESSMTLDRVRALRKQGLRMKGMQDPVAELRRQRTLPNSH